MYAYRSVGHPAAGLHLIGVQSPEFQFLFEKGSADVGRVVKLPRSATRQNASHYYYYYCNYYYYCFCILIVQTVIQYSTTAIKHLATQLINFNAFKQAKGCAPMKDRTSSRGSFISSLSLSLHCNEKSAVERRRRGRRPSTI